MKSSSRITELDNLLSWVIRTSRKTMPVLGLRGFEPPSSPRKNASELLKEDRFDNDIELAEILLAQSIVLREVAISMLAEKSNRLGTDLNSAIEQAMASAHAKIETMPKNQVPF